MKKRILYFLVTVFMGNLLLSCNKEQLDVQNPNQPTAGSAATESGITSLAQGGVYVNGFTALKSGYYDGVNGYFWANVIGIHELMGDLIGMEAANQFGNQIAVPNYVVLDDGTKVLNPNSPKEQITLLRLVNQNSNQNQNPAYHEWTYMYSLNNAMNTVLETLAATTFAGGDAAAKKSTVQAWAYWWKGFAYSRLGSMYYAGLINDKAGSTNATYVTKEKLIDEATKNFDLASKALDAAGGGDAYSSVMSKLIPDFIRTGKGDVPTPAMWKRSINTFKARNLLVNTTTKAMTAAQWGQILTLTNDGIKADDKVFTGRANDAGDFISATNGSVVAKTIGQPGSTTYKVSERLIQDFNVGDKRLSNNFAKLTSTWVGNSDRGNSFNTRYRLLDGGAGMPGVMAYGSRTAGQFELYMAGTYEENELMKAEAKLYTADLNGAMAAIDVVRGAQGAGLDPLKGLTLAQVKEELRKERRVALAFRGLSFYDARRWGVIDDVAAGGGRTGAVVISPTGVVSTKATINYGFLDYWDVPDNELAYNPPAAGSAPTKNPK